MIQLRILHEPNLSKLEQVINEFLKTLNDDAIVHDIDIEQLRDCSHRAVIRYEIDVTKYI